MNMPSTTPSSPVHSCDVPVVGGGPAGPTIGALLAERGRVNIRDVEAAAS
jgi:2-polyprenyl-6-methoxyphenol hydroxylase-like FAD-dependent oxidoreductase